MVEMNASSLGTSFLVLHLQQSAYAVGLTPAAIVEPTWQEIGNVLSDNPDLVQNDRHRAL